MSKRILAHPFFVLFKRSRGSCPLLLRLASPEGQGEGELRSERRDTPFTLFATASIHAKDRCQFVLHPYSTDHVAYIVGKMGSQFERDIVVDKEPFFFALVSFAAYKSIRPNERKGQWFEAFARKVSDTTYNPMVSIPLAMVSIP